jgi:hypothetical protein
MQFGYNNNKRRIKPTFSGQKATCPLCGGIIIGKCGKIYVWHWQHHRDRICDPWKEHETDWHRKWKAKFPDNWQEVIFDNDIEKHIADVWTSEGLVIEFQNSSISSSTIQIREDFYKNMIWVVNAKSFKNNFCLRSIVNTRLRNIENNVSYELELMTNEYNKELKTIQEEINKNSKSSVEKLSSINHKKQTVEKLNDILKNFNEYAETIISGLSQGEYFWDYNTSKIINKIKTEKINQLKEISNTIEKLPHEIQLKKQTLKNIQQLENFQIDGKQFKIIGYEQIPSKFFYQAKAISKATIKTFFPQIITFKSELEFQTYQYRKAQYDFIVDPTVTINSLTNKIEEKKKSLSTLKKSLPKLKEEIKNNLLLEFKKKMQAVENEIEQIINEWDELIQQMSHLTVEQARIIDEKEKDLTKLKRKIEKKKNEQRFKIMKEKKGLYTFEWKHERKSWRAANNPIYFDIGENYLFEKLRDGVFKKTMITEFLKNNLLKKLDKYNSRKKI